MKRIIRTRDEVNKENWKRYDKQRNEIFPKMFTDLKSLRLKRIDIAGDRNQHDHKKIKNEGFYMVGYSGSWLISRARRNFHNNGWEFWLGSHSVSLRSLDFVFEIKNLVGYDSNPLGVLSHDFDEFGDLYEEE